MNPSSAGIWCNPPPPGTEFLTEDMPSVSSNKRDVTFESEPPRTVERLDPYLKSPEYVKFDKKVKSDHSRRRSRSGSKKRSRSNSRHRRRRRSRSRSRGRHHHRRRHRSASRSRSRSRSRNRRKHDSRDRRRVRHSRSHSRSRSMSKSRSHKSHKSRSERSHRSRSRRRSRSLSRNRHPEPEIETNPNLAEEEVEEEEDEAVNENAFKNDGSFMEMFKKMQDEMKQKEAEKANQPETKTPLPAFGKRRGGKVLKTGLVQKSKVPGQEEAGDAQDAWTLYMKEVKRYKEACCDDDSKTRLLVK